MKTVRKFLFENDFDAGSAMPARNVVRKKAEAPLEPPPPPPPPPEPTFTESELAAAVAEAKAAALKEGRSKGKADAQAELAAQIESQIAKALSGIGNQVATMVASLSLDRAALLSEAAGLALAMTRRILPELTRRGGLAEVEATIERCLIDQRREKRLNIRVPVDLLPALQAKIADLAAEKHFEGRTNLIGDPALTGASCQVEWADGGLERHGDAIWRDVAAALDRCLASQGITPAELGDETQPEPAGTGDGVDGNSAAD